MNQVEFLGHLKETPPEDSELRLLSLPNLHAMPKETALVYVDGSECYPFNINFGEDEVLFLLEKDDDLRTHIDSLEKRSLDTPTCVEVRPSPIGGLGLFTTKDCLPGDLLISERL
jgi:hypothetical protein